MKQETLEEAAQKQCGNVYRTGILAFIAGAKYQAKIMYSEEEVKSILLKTDRFLRADLDIWFKQFKKK